MNKQLAKIFSLVFHPIFIPLYSILIIMSMFPFRYEYVPEKVWNITIYTILGMTMIMPGIILLIFKKLSLVDDYDISKQKQRIFPYLIFFFFYLMTFLTIKPKVNSSFIFMEDSLLATIILGATISLAIGFFLNNFLKVSVHTIGVSNLFLVICFLSRNTQKMTLFIILVSLIVVGLTGASRILLRAHSPKEVYYGIFTGVIGQLIAFITYFDITL